MDRIRALLLVSGGNEEEVQMTWILPVAVSLIVIIVFSQFGPMTKNLVSAFVGRLRVMHLKNSLNAETEEEGDATLSGIFIYPVKSLKAVSLDEAIIDDKGLVGDRRFMLVAPRPPQNYGQFGPKDATYQFMTQRQIPSLATIQAIVSKNGDGFGSLLTLSSYLLGDRKVTIQPLQEMSQGATYRAKIWDDVTEVIDLGDEVASFLKDVVKKDKNVTPLSEQVRLVCMKKDDRVADDKYTPREALSWSGMPPKVSLADGFPVLISNEASLEELNRRLRDKGRDEIPMSRFRPNIVVSGTKPFEEDTWKVISIEGVIFHLVKGCPRCKQSCTDQETGTLSTEPLQTLSEFRSVGPIKENVYFAQNAIAHDSGGTIRVGAAIHVLERGDPVWDS